MNQRQADIFKTIVQTFIKTAVPISSQQVLAVSKLDVSSATVRNDMAALEQQGLIAQPHTSAGRIPTELGYQLYVEDYLTKKKLSQKQIAALQEFLQDQQAEYTMKFLAKALAQFSGLLVFVAFGRDDIYYTGLSHLLAQPEFVNYERVYDISKVIDHMDDVIHSVFDEITHDIQITIGSQNPFSNQTSALLSRYASQGNEGVFGIIGPMRMDYDKNFSLIEYAKEVLK